MTKVKICGITNLEDALLSIEAGADMLGFNFYERSPRYITPQQVKMIVEDLPPRVVKIGVFVNSSLTEIADLYSNVPLDYIQLHGDETSDFVSQLRTRIGVKVIKVIRVSGCFQPEVAFEYDVDHFMLDSDSKMFGGSGETFDWNAAINFKAVAPQFFLAGGLTPENVCDAIRKVTPFAVDVCSGVESAKGKKDLMKVNDFVRNAKNAL